MSRSEDIAAIRCWLDQTDDGGSFAWHAAMAAIGCIQAEVDEIEVTPEMIEAGLRVAWSDAVPPEFVIKQVQRIYIAMERARRGRSEQ